eukprot:TRINITY_DN18532_c0_g2_i2.p1 TRINITY_DN18532_c0_g2~~TRINITY_DN18532_c0_g2_i2.p1  ORF type:complete len:857 (-),score=253.24 TRINITY_DN18532_c0_g2_i2:93-2663(-)
MVEAAVAEDAANAFTNRGRGALQERRKLLTQRKGKHVLNPANRPTKQRPLLDLPSAPPDVVEAHRQDARAVLGPLWEALMGALRSQDALALALSRPQSTASDVDEDGFFSGGAFDFGAALAEAWVQVLADDVALPAGLEQIDSRVTALLEYLHAAVQLQPNLSAQGLLAAWGYQTIVRSQVNGGSNARPASGLEVRSDSDNGGAAANGHSFGRLAGLAVASKAVQRRKGATSGAAATSAPASRSGARARSTTPTKARATHVCQREAVKRQMNKFQTEALESSEQMTALMERKNRIARLQAELAKARVSDVVLAEELEEVDAPTPSESPTTPTPSSGRPLAKPSAMPKWGGQATSSARARTPKKAPAVSALTPRGKQQARASVKEESWQAERRLTSELEDLDRKMAAIPASNGLVTPPADASPEAQQQAGNGRVATPRGRGRGSKSMEAAPAEPLAHSSVANGEAYDDLVLQLKAMEESVERYKAEKVAAEKLAAEAKAEREREARQRAEVQEELSVQRAMNNFHQKSAQKEIKRHQEMEAKVKAEVEARRNEAEEAKKRMAEVQKQKEQAEKAKQEADARAAELKARELEQEKKLERLNKRHHQERAFAKTHPEVRLSKRPSAAPPEEEPGPKQEQQQTPRQHQHQQQPQPVPQAAHHNQHGKAAAAAAKHQAPSPATPRGGSTVAKAAPKGKMTAKAAPKPAAKGKAAAKSAAATLQVPSGKTSPPAPPSPPPETLQPPPERLVLHCPDSEADCDGDYTLLPQQVNGYPMWEHQDGQHWLFSGPGGQWFFGDEMEKEDAFDCNTGHIASHAEHNGAWPHKIPQGQWQRFDDPNWIDDQAITVTLPVATDFSSDVL